MSVFSLYFSPTGGVQRVARQLVSVWDSCEWVDLSDPETDFGRFCFSACDICYISIPVFEGRVPAAALQRLRQVHAEGAAAVLVAVFGNRAIDDALLELKNEAAAIGFRPAAAVGAVAEHSIFRQYASGRPDAQDQKELVAFARRIREALESASGNTGLEVPGSFPYRQAGGSSLKPQANDACTGCGLCAQQCPVRAIPLQNPSQTDHTACIACMRCIAVCPVHARTLNQQILDAVAQKLHAIFEGRKPNTLYLCR